MRIKRNRVEIDGRLYIPAAILILIALFGLVGRSARNAVRAQATSDFVVQDQRSVIAGLEAGFISIAKHAEPGVVSITAVQQNTTNSGNSSIKSFLDRFAAKPDGKNSEPGDGWDDSDAPVTASGSGTIIRRDQGVYYVLTNFHLVEKTYVVTVRLADRTILKGRVIGTDPVTDLAVVAISSPKLTERNIIPLGDSNAAKVGSWVLAVGNPYGFEHTVTVGVVSAIHRDLEEEGTTYSDLIQTDAAINKGNSGGPLMDMHGNVIGINSAIASPTGGFIGLGFAIPINIAKEILDDLISRGRVVRGWLGVTIQELTPVLQKYYGVGDGVLVASVSEKGPAASAGILSEDVIVKIAGTPIGDTGASGRKIASLSPGDVVPVTVVRGGVQHTLTVKVGLAPLTPTSRPTPPESEHGSMLRVQTLTSELAKQAGIRTRRGVLVTDIWPDSAAQEAGLEEGDVVVSFNHQPLSTQEQFDSMLGMTARGDVVVLRVLRSDSPRMIGFRRD
jgi:serine protease Do